MASRLEQVPWEASWLEHHRDRALEAYAKRRQGVANPAIGYFAPIPWLAKGLIDLHPEYGLLLRVEHELLDLVQLVVCQENSCRFCYAAVRAMLWAQGMSRERIERMEGDLTRADLSPRTRAAMLFGRSQSRSGPAEAPAARDALLRAGFSVDEMKEIAFGVCLTDFSNRAHTIAAVPTRPFERMPDQLPLRLLRPWINRLVRRSRYHGQAPAGERPFDGPYARLARAYAGSPIVPAVAQVLDEMWASPHLTRRCKLLTLAVIARGLGCGACAPDLAEALRKEGLTDQTIGQVLTHLDAPELDPVERLLVPFARETIWYEPAAIQRRARSLRDRLSGPQVLEAIGVASLGNGLCRMGAVVLEPA
jgi:alkylhydroperoxidase family enzyme